MLYGGLVAVVSKTNILWFLDPFKQFLLFIYCICVNGFFSFRTLIAMVHGYETYADMAISHQMAANVDNVLNLLE